MKLSLPSAAFVLAAFALAAAQPLKPAPESPKPATPAPASPSSKAKPATAANPVAVTVGTVSIRKGKIDTLAGLMARARGANLDALPPEQALLLRRLVTTNLIGQELLELEAKASGVQATAAETDSAIALLKSQFPDSASWRDALRRNGDTEAGLRAKVARQIRADKLLAARLRPPGSPTEKELRAFWEENRKEFPVNDSLRALQILLLAGEKTPPDSAAAKKRRLEAVRRELAADSADVTELLRSFMGQAARIGEGPEARRGGDLERFHPSDFHAEFAKQAKALSVGQMSPVFRTPLGFHLILLIEKFDGKFESYRLQSLQNLLARKNVEMGLEMRDFLKGLAAKHPVKYVIPSYRDESESGIY